MSIKKKSVQVMATDPSEEFPYTWIDIKRPETGPFFKYQNEARADAERQYHGFQIGCHVVIVQVLEEINTK